MGAVRKETAIMERKQPDFNFNLGETVNNWLQDFIKELAERLEKMEEILVVDRIEGNIAVCQNRQNGKMKNIPIQELPSNIKEGSILKWEKGSYQIDEKNEIEDRIKAKMKDVWK